MEEAVKPVLLEKVDIISSECSQTGYHLCTLLNLSQSCHTSSISTPSLLVYVRSPLAYVLNP